MKFYKNTWFYSWLIVVICLISVVITVYHNDQRLNNETKVINLQLKQNEKNIMAYCHKYDPPNVCQLIQLMDNNDNP